MKLGKQSPFVGTWRIVEMEMWDSDALDMVGPATLEVRADGLGRLGFIAIEADIDARAGERDGRPVLEFTFAGFDEGDPLSGRAWATLEGDDRLVGRLYLHLGDDSSFMAERQTVRRGSPRKPRRTATSGR